MHSGTSATPSPPATRLMMDAISGASYSTGGTKPARTHACRMHGSSVTRSAGGSLWSHAGCPGVVAFIALAFALCGGLCICLRLRRMQRAAAFAAADAHRLFRKAGTLLYPSASLSDVFPYLNR